MAPRKTILVTGIGGNTAQGVARSLLKFQDEFTVIGSDSDRYNYRFGLKYAKKVYLLPRANDEDYIDAVSRTIRKENIDVIVPSPEPEVNELSKHRHELDVNLLLPNHKVIETTQDKWLTHQILKDKVQQPKSFLIGSYKDLERGFSEIEKPLWIRRRRGVGGSKALVAHRLEDARFWVEYWGGYGEFIAHEILPGRNLSWIGLYRDGELIASGGYQRLRYFLGHISPTGVTGNVSVAMTINDDELNDAAEMALQVLDDKPNGVYTIDLKEDGKPNVTEVNSGRFHMSFYTYTEAGLNLPLYYAKLALDEPFDSPPKRNGLRAGVVAIRNTDNEPIFLSSAELGKDVLIP